MTEQRGKRTMSDWVEPLQAFSWFMMGVGIVMLVALVFTSYHPGVVGGVYVLIVGVVVGVVALRNRAKRQRGT